MPDSQFNIEKKPLLDINSDEDPSIPYSGIDSSTIFPEETQSKSVAQMVERRKRERSQLLPVAELLFGLIREERYAIGNIRAYMKTLGEKPSGEDVAAEFRARELYTGYLDRFEQMIATRLEKTPKRLRGQVYGTPKRP